MGVMKKLLIAFLAAWEKFPVDQQLLCRREFSSAFFESSQQSVALGNAARTGDGSSHLVLGAHRLAAAVRMDRMHWWELLGCCVAGSSLESSVPGLSQKLIALCLSASMAYPAIETAEQQRRGETAFPVANEGHGGQEIGFTGMASDHHAERTSFHAVVVVGKSIAL